MFLLCTDASVAPRLNLITDFSLFISAVISLFFLLNESCMKKVMIGILSVVVVAALFGQDMIERTIYLKNGDKISGIIISETDSSLIIRSSFGDISISKSDVKVREVTLMLKDGNRVTGEVIQQTSERVVIRSSLGTLSIRMAEIDRITEAGEKLPGTTSREEFFYSQERLIDVFFDPTGYTLEKGSVYLSGLSWGVALTEYIDISSSYWRYFFADLNIRPKFQIFRGGTVEVEDALSIGFHIHSAGPTGKFKAKDELVPVYDYTVNMSRMESQTSWDDIGSTNDYFVWTELFFGYTRSYLKDDKRGRIVFHLGGSVILHREETMPRGWIAVENDVTDRFKVLGQLYFDPFAPSYRERIQDTKTRNPFDLDFGFVYAYNENLRIGIHYQPYVILFYYKF